MERTKFKFNSDTDYCLVSKYGLKKYGPTITLYMAMLFYLYYITKEKNASFDGYFKISEIDEFIKDHMKIGRQALISRRWDVMSSGLMVMQWKGTPKHKCYKINWNNTSVKKMNPYSK